MARLKPHPIRTTNKRMKDLKRIRDTGGFDNLDGVLEILIGMYDDFNKIADEHIRNEVNPNDKP